MARDRRFPSPGSKTAPANDAHGLWSATEHRLKQGDGAREGGILDRDLKGSLATMERSPAQLSASLLAQKCVAVPPNASTTQQATRGSWVNLLRTAWGTWGTQALALADQAVVSGASFLTTVVIGRWTFPSQLGVYSIGISLLVSSLVIQ